MRTVGAESAVNDNPERPEPENRYRVGGNHREGPGRAQGYACRRLPDGGTAGNACLMTGIQDMHSGNATHGRTEAVSWKGCTI